jgi:hypothetical protein
MRTIIFLLAVLFSIAIASCGGGGGGGGESPPPATVCSTCSNSIMLDGTVTPVTNQPITKANGGTVAVVGSVQLTGTTVVIPAGSLPADTHVTIGQVSNSSLVPSDVLVTDIGPSGTLLDPTLPATLSIKYDPQYLTDKNITDTSTLKVVAFDDNVAAETLPQISLDSTNNLLTTKTTHFSHFAVLGYSNASIKGYYRMGNYFFNRNAVPVLAPSVGNVLPTPQGFGDGEMTLGFDGNGNWTEYDETRNTDGVISLLPAASLCSGTYTVAPDGTLTIIFAGSSNCTGNTNGQVLAGGGTFVLSPQMPGDPPEFDVGVQRINSNYSNASMSGPYSLIHADFSTGPTQGPAPSVGSPLPALQGFTNSQGTATFDGNSNWSWTGLISGNGVITPSTTSGTYSVASDGTFNLTDPGSNIDKGQILAGGKVVISVQGNAAHDPGISVAIKLEAGSFSNATLNGKYTVITYGYDYTSPQGVMPNPGQTLPPPNGFFSAITIVVFDGIGGYTQTGSLNNDGNISALSMSGTYTVDSTGAISSSGGLSGQVLGDGSTFIGGTTAPGIKSEIDVGLIR